jgi:cell division protein FtsB
MIGRITKYFGSNDLILVGALVIALGLVWSTVEVMQRNYYLQQKFNKLSAEVELQKIENQNLRYNINYLKTDDYLELAARSKFNKASPGETMVYLPKKGETEQAVVAKNKVAPARKQPTGWQANISDWWQFLQGNNAVNKS